ncbi:methyltransferase [Thermomonospora umbrina]|uniref:Hydroxyneurosporene-O-methyltransferase n=1 Tax=Thermomonospora umbrina TaxID=111806 RepID=A0A3D9STB1_9ACTN|nr:methyltransferase [Thermomonospora umbrina]REE97720.1 hydroxyneurosporene-O-methyltransferase [Thermomonospora umbrina]
MSDASPFSVADDPRAAVEELQRGWWRYTAMHAWVELDCSDHLADGPLTAEQLAERCSAHAPTLARLLRVMASLGFVTVDPEAGTYALTEVGEVLRADAPNSMKPSMVVAGDRLSWDAMLRLPEVVRTGRTHIAEEHGSLYRYFAGKPDLEAAFAAFMTSRSRSFATALLETYDFGGRRTLVDVGGGVGTILAAVLVDHPEMRGVLLDLPTVAATAQRYLDECGVADRCEVVAGDFLTDVPGKADLYLLSSIVHNWPDETAVEILRAVRNAMGEDSRLLLLDILQPDVPERPHLAFDLDIRMLSLFGQGHERPRTEYFALLREAGFRVVNDTELSMGATLVEAAPAG